MVTVATLNDQIRREIPELSKAALGGDAPDEMIHLASDFLVRPVWDATAQPLSENVIDQREMRQRLWRLLGERLANDDIVARVAFERWLLQPFVSNDPAAVLLRSEAPDDLQRIIDGYVVEMQSCLSSLRGLSDYTEIIDAAIADYDGLILLTSILERLADHVLPLEGRPGADGGSREAAQEFLDIIEESIGVNGYIDEAIRETIVEALRYSTMRDHVRAGPRLRGLSI
jgi:hypothetical protein